MGVIQLRNWFERSGKRGGLYITRPPCALCIIRMSEAISRSTANALCTEGRYPKVHNVGYRPSV